MSRAARRDTPRGGRRRPAAKAVSRRRAKGETLLTLRQLECLESPVRIELFGALRALGPSSIRDLGRYVGRRPDTLYYHVRALQDVGLVVVHEQRAAGARREAVYRLKEKPYGFRALREDRAYRASAVRAARNVSRVALRHYARAVAAIDRDPGVEDALDFHIAFARLPPARLARLKKDLQQLLTDALGDGGEGGERVLAVAILTPVGGV